MPGTLNQMNPAFVSIQKQHTSTIACVCTTVVSTPKPYLCYHTVSTWLYYVNRVASALTTELWLPSQRLSSFMCSINRTVHRYWLGPIVVWHWWMCRWLHFGVAYDQYFSSTENIELVTCMWLKPATWVWFSETPYLFSPLITSLDT